MKIIELKMVARGRIELPTRGFSVLGRWMKLSLHQRVSQRARCVICPTMQDSQD
jgi:hypothetical protein